MRSRRAALLGALVLAVGGCGVSTRSGSSSSGAGPASVSGHQVFTRSCSFCHSLSGHSSPRQQGGDLLGDPLRRPVLRQFTAEMPVKHPLTKAELNAVVDYVLAVQRRRR